MEIFANFLLLRSDKTMYRRAEEFRYVKFFVYTVVKAG